MPGKWKKKRSGGMMGIWIFVCLVPAAIAFIFITRPIVWERYSLAGKLSKLVDNARNLTPALKFSYGKDPLQFAELRLPDFGTDFPGAIVLHGGCWSNKVGEWPEDFVSYKLTAPLSAALAKEGIATWNVEYRRLGDNGGGWPGSYRDIAAAADFLRNIAAEKHLNLRHVIIVGHSSGGQLAIWLAARKKLPPSSPLYMANPLPVAAVVDIDGPPSLSALAQSMENICGSPVVEEFMGGSPAEVPSHYAEGSADSLLPLNVPQYLFYSDKTEFFSSPEAWAEWEKYFTLYADAATRTGDKVYLSRMNEAGHFDGISPSSAAWPMILKKIHELADTR